LSTPSSSKTSAPRGVIDCKNKTKNQQQEERKKSSEEEDGANLALCVEENEGRRLFNGEEVNQELDRLRLVRQTQSSFRERFERGLVFLLLLGFRNIDEFEVDVDYRAKRRDRIRTKCMQYKHRLYQFSWRLSP
jgi:hypothetical protein